MDFGVSLFGVTGTGFRGLWFPDPGFLVRDFRFGVFKVRGFRYRVLRFGVLPYSVFLVRGFPYNVS